LSKFIEERKTRGITYEIHDWCYVYNFIAPDQPRILKLPQGIGKSFGNQMEDLLKALKEEIPKTFGSEEYTKKKQEVMEEHQRKYQGAIDALEKESAGKEDNEYFKRFRFAISGGPGYRTYSVGDGLTSNSKDYYSKLKLGYQIECDATYFFSAKRGAGLKFSYFNTSNSIDNNIWLFNNGFLSQGKFAEDIMILFAGPVFSTRISTPGSINSFLFNVSVGYIYYKDKIVSISDYAITGNTAGFTIDLNYDRVISKRLSLGVLVSITNGTLSKVTQTSSSGSQSFYWNEGLTRIDLGIGLRF